MDLSLRTINPFRLVFDLMNLDSESDQWLQSYEQLKDSQTNGKQMIFFPLSGYISQSMLPTFN